MTTAKRRPRIIDINLLPREQRPLEVAPAAAAVVLVLLVCVAGLVPLAFRAQDARDAAATMERQADDALTGVRSLELNLARQRALRNELESAKATLARVQQQQEQLQGGKRPLKDDLTMLFGYGSFLPPRVRVTAISGGDGVLTVDGVAPGPLDAIAYADTLVKSGGFTSARLSSFAPAARDTGQFTIEVER